LRFTSLELARILLDLVPPSLYSCSCGLIVILFLLIVILFLLIVLFVLSLSALCSAEVFKPHRILDVFSVCLYAGCER